MAFRAHPSRSINLLILRGIRCRNKSGPTSNQESEAETPGGLLPPGATEVKPQTSVIVESTGLTAPKKVAISSKDSQARDPQRQPSLAYPPEHYFDTHQTVTKLRALGQFNIMRSCKYILRNTIPTYKFILLSISISMSRY
jgi:hypothetical protein